MPPKPKYSREDIINTAYELVKESGFEALIARDLGKRLGCSTSPLFTVFKNMEELKLEVFSRAKDEFFNYLLTGSATNPTYKEIGVRWMNYARTETNLYRMLFYCGKNYQLTADDFITLNIDRIHSALEDLRDNFKLDATEAVKVLTQIIIYSSGVAALSMNREKSFSENDLVASLSETYLGYIFYLKAKKGRLNTDTVNRIASALA